MWGLAHGPVTGRVLATTGPRILPAWLSATSPIFTAIDAASESMRSGAGPLRFRPTGSAKRATDTD